MKMYFKFFVLVLLFLSTLESCVDHDNVMEREVLLVIHKVNGKNLIQNETIEGIGVDVQIELGFSVALDTAGIVSTMALTDSLGHPVPIAFEVVDEHRTILLKAANLLPNKTFLLKVSDQVRGQRNEVYKGANFSFRVSKGYILLVRAEVDGQSLTQAKKPKRITLNPEFSFTFNQAVSPDIRDFVSLNDGAAVDLDVRLNAAGTQMTILPKTRLDGYQQYTIGISDRYELADYDFSGFESTFYTKLDSTIKFPVISDEALLTQVQEQTFKYFWDFGHPVSGLARERNTSGETVTSGGSGFGMMAILVGIERGFIAHQEGINRLGNIITFLHDRADRFHGAFSHWINGTTGAVVPFASDDDGGDLVETAFLVQGLLTVRQYLDASIEQESAIIDQINDLWHGVEWDWYTQGGQNVLYWHWSPNYEWQKNHEITGWNEALMVYLLAAASPTHPVDKDVYVQGWSRNGAMVNSSSESYDGYQLDLRSDKGGPLFFSHYSFMGLDPRNLSDQYANYWHQNVSHTRINHAYCADNPKEYIGYTEYCWGLTASDNHEGYSAHSPDNDLGVISPTAALSSMPYTPEESMKALRHFYYILGDQLWGEYGFYDAFNLTESWTASSYLAIDQGPIVVMIENYRTGLLWDLFMSAPEVQIGLDKLGFLYEK